MDLVGERIKKEREKQGVSLENIAGITRISVDILRKIENNDFNNLPAKPYVRGFLIAIAKVLSVSADEIVNCYLVNIKEMETAEEKDPGKTGGGPFSRTVNEELREDVIAASNEPSKLGFGKEDEEEIEGGGDLIEKIPFTLPSPTKRIRFVVAFLICVAAVVAIVFFSNKESSRESPSGDSTASLSMKREVIVKRPPEEVGVSHINAKAGTEETGSGDLKKKKSVARTGSYSTLKLFGRGRSWLKVQIDGEEVKAMTFMVGMTKVFRVYDLARLYIGNSSMVDVFFQERKIDSTAMSDGHMLSLKHVPDNILSQKKQPVRESVEKVDMNLISPPELTPEQLTR